MQAKIGNSEHFLLMKGYTAFMDARGRPAKNERSPLGERIAIARKAIGLSQQELAEKMGLAQQTIVSWERRSTNLRSDTIIKLAQVLKVSADELLGLKTVDYKNEAPGGRSRKVFQEVASLPRREQEKMLESIENLIAGYKARKSS